MTAEEKRLAEARERTAHWKRWGPYLTERQWGTVREDYSPYGTAWDSFPHDHARSRVYRWGEDGLFGISDIDSRIGAPVLKGQKSGHYQPNLNPPSHWTNTHSPYLRTTVRYLPPASVLVACLITFRL